jgi:hypothetical protein
VKARRAVGGFRRERPLHARLDRRPRVKIQALGRSVRAKSLVRSLFFGVVAGAFTASACSRSPRPGAPLASDLSVSSPSSAADAAPLLPIPRPAPSASAMAPPAPLCGEAGSLSVFVSPERPVRGQPLRVVAVAEHPIDARLTLTGPGREPLTSATEERHGGPPYYWLAQVDAPAAGAWHVALVRSQACGGEPTSKKEVSVSAWRAAPSTPVATATLWPVRSQWSARHEDLYSAWIDHLFDAPLDAQPSWPALHEVLRDRARNFLFDHLGAAEDEKGIVVRPDCADLPYFLRAYFADKLGLPFGWSRCSRGEGGTPPVCSDFATNLEPFPPIDGKPQPLPAWADPDREPDPRETDAKRFGDFIRTTLADAAQSGAGRTPARDETGDYYPVALSIDTLRPGTIFADPYGHVLVVARRLEQTAERGGILLAVDGQPDGTVARKRFWEGNFLFAIDPALGSAGFKRFRPLVRDKSGKLRRLGNAELADFSLDQYSAGVEGFYDKVGDVLSPSPLDPMQALLETLQALEEQVRTRVVSVDNGRKFLASGKPAAEMPDGAKIFETTGDWEDFSTPSRDLRLLIAIDVARSLPARVARRPQRYAMPPGKSAAAVSRELEERLARELGDRAFKYTRTDGSEWELRLKDVVDRQAALEVAYNPNECVEHRWGAPPDGPEASTCRGRAPEPQVAKMDGYRAWFHERKRPPR